MSSSRLRDRFAFRVFRAFALVLLAVTTAYTALAVVSQNQIIRAQLLVEGETYAQILARGTRVAVYAEDKVILGDAIRGVMEAEHILAVSIFDESLRLMAEAERADPGPRLPTSVTPADRAALARLGPGRKTEIVEEPQRFVVWSPVTLRTEAPASDDLFFTPTQSGTPEAVIGFVRLSLDKGFLERERHRTLTRGLGLFAAFLLGAGVLVYLLARRVTTPLATLNAEVREVGRSGAAAPVTVHGAAEIAQLAESFNAMVGSLQAREAEKARLEAELLASRKLEAVGTLARGISHDFNNILSTVKGAVHILEKRFRDDEFLLRYTGKINASLGRARELIEGLITFSRSKQLQLRPLDLGALIADLEPTLREVVGDAASLEIALPRDPLRVEGDDLSLKQVLLNLVTNARDALPEGGRIRITLATAEGLPPPEAGRDPERRQGAAVRLSVSDTGTGMDAATVERIFEPFYTTKEVGRGTGLGLSIVHGIVEQHRGRIEVRSEPGRGTTVLVELPRAESCYPAGRGER